MKQNERFYGSDVPTFPHEPSTNDFEVAHNDTIGSYVVSKSHFKRGKLLFRFAGMTTPIVTQHSLQISNSLHIVDSKVVGLLAHSCEPNVHLDMQELSVYALVDIQEGDVIFMDYAQTEAKLFRNFQCSCGSPSCRGYITGYMG